MYILFIDFIIFFFCFCISLLKWSFPCCVRTIALCASFAFCAPARHRNFCPFALVLRAYVAAATKQKQGRACAAQKRGKQMFEIK